MINDWIQKRAQAESVTPTVTLVDSTWSILAKSAKKSGKLLSSMISSSAAFFDGWDGRINPAYNSNEKFQDYTQKIQDLDPSSTYDSEGYVKGSVGKAIHKMNDHQYMVKPYHNDAEFTTGWNTMTTNQLYQKAGMGNMIEDAVPTSINHEGVSVPVIASKFHEDHIVAQDHQSPSLRPKDVAQMALMDYLTDNRDRHAENLLVSNELDGDDGYNSIVAIDHDYSFDYGRVSSALDHPEHYHQKFQEMHGNAYNLHPEEIADLASWWTKHALDIKDSFHDSLNAISDEKLKHSLSKGFTDRFNTLSRWATNTHEADLQNIPVTQYPHAVAQHSPFELGVDPVRDIPPDVDDHFAMDTIGRLAFLAKEDFSGTITDTLTDQSDSSANMGYLVASTLYSAGGMKPSEWVEALKKTSQTKFAKTVQAELINKMIQAKDQPTLNYIYEANKKTPFLSPIMAYHIKHNLES